jgi:cytochrome oxidase Cu insertion factor (SCO1/SenC/PrrC family)
MSDRPHRKLSRQQLLLIASLFFVPLLAAVLLYFSSDWRPAPEPNGRLIDPPQRLPKARLFLRNGKAARADILRGHRFLVHPVESRCEERCVALLDELGRVRLALDKDAVRVRRVLLHTGLCCSEDFPLKDEDLLVLGATGRKGEALRTMFPLTDDGSPGIYIVDPQGNLIMSYPASGSGQGLLEDLERLLRLSKIG